MDVEALAQGTVLADRRLLSCLGRGGEGEVWRAERPDGSHCALKVVRPDMLPSADEIRRRGQWLVRIDHPALVQVSRGGRFTGGRLNGWGFVEMDLVEGGPVPVPLEDAMRLLAPVAEALDMLHAGAWSDGVPLVHRDIKPGNLVLGTDGLVLVDPSTMRGLDTVDLTKIGTPAYVAPEVATGRFGPLADVYSLAATAAALLTGHRGAALAPVLRDPAAHGLPAGVVAGLAPDPADRPPTCAAVVQPPLPPGPWRPQRWPLAALVAVLGTPVVERELIGAGVVEVGPLGGVSTGLVVATVLHLAVHVITRRPVLGLLAPPWAWGDLLADLHDPEDRRGRWAADTIAGTVLVALAALVVPAAADALEGTVGEWGPAVVIGGGALLIELIRRTADAGRVAFGVVALVTAPLRALGGGPRVLVTGGRR